MRKTFSILLLLLLVTLPRLASAHAVLLDAMPADGSRVDAPPSMVMLHFNEPVVPIEVRLVDANGHTIAGPGGTSTMDEMLHLGLPANLPAGIYTLSYRVTSADSHPVAGALLFGIGVSPAAPAMQPADHAGNDLSGSIFRSIIRAIGDAAILVAAGGALFLIAIGPVAIERVLLAAIGVAAFAALLGLGLQGEALGGMASGTILDAMSWRLGMASSLGIGTGLVLAGGALLAAGLLSRLRLVQLAGAAILLASFVVSGHAATAAPLWLTMPAMFLHVLGLAFWIGSLWPLYSALAANGPHAAPLLQRFSRIAMVAIGTLAIAGILLLANQVRSFAALVTTDYGRILLVKLVLVLALLSLALYNKLRLTPALAAGDASAATRLCGIIRHEMTLIGAILFLTGLLGTTPPPRALALASPSVGLTQRTTISGEGGSTLRLELSPGRTGQNHLTLALADRDGAVMAAKQVNIELTLPTAGIEPLTRTAEAMAAGEWHLMGPEFSIPGRWHVRADVLITDFKMLSFETDIDIGK